MGAAVSTFPSREAGGEMSKLLTEVASPLRSAAGREEVTAALLCIIGGEEVTSASSTSNTWEL